MSYTVTRFEPTPNPNALKCILNRSLPGPPQSFRSAADVGDDPLARAFFEISGVSGVLLSGGWLTVNKRPEADWARIKTGVQQVLSRLPAAAADHPA